MLCWRYALLSSFSGEEEGRGLLTFISEINQNKNIGNVGKNPVGYVVEGNHSETLERPCLMSYSPAIGDASSFS